MSKEIICVYGDENNHVTLPLDTLGAPIHSAQTYGSGRTEFRIVDNKSSSRGLVQAYSWCQLRTTLREEPDGINLIKALDRVQSADATDNRDKVYSVLGLLHKRDRRAIRVDYSSSNTVEQVYMDLASYCVGTDDCMRMLAHAGTKQQISNVPF